MSKSKKSGLGKFLLGAGIGVGLGILFAPKSGKETRADLKKKMDDLIEKARNVDIEEVKVTIEKKVNEIKEDLKNLDKEMLKSRDFSDSTFCRPSSRPKSLKVVSPWTLSR